MKKKCEKQNKQQKLGDLKSSIQDRRTPSKIKLNLFIFDEWQG
jgi:hypothetical protein